MAKFRVSVMENSYGAVDVEADSPEEAYEKAEAEYHKGNVRWTSSEFTPQEDEGMELAEDVSQAAITAFDCLRSHVGHQIEVAIYGDGQNVSVECVDCYEVLYSLDNPIDGDDGS